MQIDADEEVQLLVEEVDIVVESTAGDDDGWQPERMRRYTPQDASSWPLHMRLDRRSTPVFYQVSASARDSHGAIVAEARVISDSSQRSTKVLQLRFDRECVRLPELCGQGLTCAFGSCVDARTPLAVRPDESAERSSAGASGSGDGVVIATAVETATASQACDVEGARTCAGRASRKSLLCNGGSWQSEPECDDKARCDTRAGETHGTCVPIAAQCANRKPDEPFCDEQNLMRICTDLVASEVRPCGSNEQCVSIDAEASCACRPGFIDQGSGCREANDCTDQGGCDPLTTCSVAGSSRICGPCPDGYTGDGATGCSPFLSALTLTGGVLVPEFAAEQTQYTLSLPMLAQRVTLTAASAAPDAALMVNGEPVAQSQPWTSQVLALGETKLELSVESPSGTRRTYGITLQREGVQDGYLKASQVDGGDNFGIRVAAFGNTLVVGAPLEDGGASPSSGAPDNSVSDSGAAYVFVREDGGWRQEAYLKAGEVVADDLFGAGVTIEGDTIVVGAPGHNFLTALGTGQRNGSVYVFTRSAGSWQQTARVMAEDVGDIGDGFGLDVSLDRDTMAVGAPLDDAGATRSGAAYLFTRTGTTWTQAQRFKASTPMAEARFGGSLALSGDRLLVGAPQEDTTAARSGAAYVFSRGGATWMEAQRLLAPEVRAAQQFGYDVALQGDMLLVSAPNNGLETLNMAAGEVYVYQLSDAEWTPMSTLTASVPRAADYFGSALALTDTTLLVGASGDASGARGVGADADRSDAPSSGAGYLYAWDGKSWQLSSYLKASNADGGDAFGESVALSDDSIAIGASKEASAGQGIDPNSGDNGSTDSGSVYVFR